MMFGINTDSDAIMHLIKEGSTGAEIGVWKGSTSKKFFKRNPKKLYLVDVWSTNPYEKILDKTKFNNFLERYSELIGSTNKKDFNDYYEEVYQSLKKTYKNKPNVEIIRKTSIEFFKSFNEKLDWIYVDGDHQYEGCLRDLNSALKIVNKGGLILGDDYDWGYGGKAGVIKAVNEFVKTHNLKLNQHGRRQFSINV